MATLQKIRTKGAVFIIILVGLALFGFIAGEDIARMMQSASNEKRMVVGKVYGEKIMQQEFQELIEEYENAVRFTNPNITLNQAMETQLRDQVWVSYINNKLYTHEAEKLGLVVTDEEMRTVISQGTSSLLTQTPFRNEKTGRFDATVLQKFLTDYESMQSNISQMPAEYVEYYNNLYNYWMFVEKRLRDECLAHKYQALLAKCLLGNSICNKAAYEARVNINEVIMAALPYSSIIDTEIKTDDSELKTKYNELKPAFKQTEETRDIKYIDVVVTASAADKAALDKEMNAAAQMLETNADPAQVIHESGSTIPYYQVPVSKKAFNRHTDIADRLDSLSVGQIIPPYYNASDNTMNTIKLIAKTQAPDSVQFRQIQVAGQDQDAVNKTADSIMTALKAGAPFDSIAARYSQTGEKKWLTSTDYETATLDANSVKYLTTVNNMPANTTEKIDFDEGCIIVQVTDRRSIIDKYNIVVVKRPIEFSKETYAKAYNNFSQFIAANPSLSEIETNAMKSGYNLQEHENLYSNEHYVGGVTDTHEAMRWIFDNDTKVGDVSPLYECGNNDHMLVAIVTGIHKKGYRTQEDAKDYLTAEVVKDKKAQQLINKMSEAKTIDKAKALKDAVTDTISRVNFAANAFVRATASSEPMLSAVACKTEAGKTSAPFKGNAGVYMIKVLKKSKNAEKYDAEKEKKQQQTARLRAAMSRIANDLYENAEVTDNRYLFY